MCKKCNSNAQNKEDLTPLDIAVRYNRIPVISQFLTNKQCDPNVQIEDGNTPLHIAVWCGWENTVISVCNGGGVAGVFPFLLLVTKAELKGIKLMFAN